MSSSAILILVQSGEKIAAASKSELEDSHSSSHSVASTSTVLCLKLNFGLGYRSICRSHLGEPALVGSKLDLLRAPTMS